MLGVTAVAALFMASPTPFTPRGMDAAAVIGMGMATVAADVGAVDIAVAGVGGIAPMVAAIQLIAAALPAIPAMAVSPVAAAAIRVME
jgi:hypothetical protein